MLVDIDLVFTNLGNFTNTNTMNQALFFVVTRKNGTKCL